MVFSLYQVYFCYQKQSVTLLIMAFYIIARCFLTETENNIATICESLIYLLYQVFRIIRRNFTSEMFKIRQKSVYKSTLQNSDHHPEIQNLW